MKRCVETGLCTGVSCCILRVLGDGQSVFNVSRGREEDKIPNVVVKAVGFKAKTFGRMSNSEIETVAEFALQVWIADLKRKIPRVWSKVVQLFQCGRAVRVRVIRYEGAVFPSVHTHADGARQTSEVSVWKNSARICGFRGVAVGFDSAAKL